MKNTQLMTGNKVLYKGQVMTIDIIARGHVALQELSPSKEKYSDWIDLDEIEFIPLTQELLKTTNLAKHPDNWQWDVGLELDLVFHFSEWILWYEATQVQQRTLEYLHQLQNVYYWLNDKELTFKPE